MFCPKCGTEMRDSASYCPGCGAKAVKDSNPEKAAPAQHTAPVPDNNTN